MAKRMTISGPTFQYEDQGRITTISDNPLVQERVNRKFEIRLESRRQDTHPQINGGKPFTIATYTRNLNAGECPTPEQSFEVFNVLSKEDAQYIIVNSKDGKEQTQYTQEFLKICYDRYVNGYQSTEEVEQLINEVADAD